VKRFFLFSSVIAAWFALSFVKEAGGADGKFHTYLGSSRNLSINPPVARTGAPDENNCTQCHLGSVLSAGGVVNLNFSGLGGAYYPDSTYEFTLEIPSGIKNGFEMTILDENDDQAGTFTAGPNTTSPNFNGRDYIRHSASAGMHSWTFNWTAPSDNVGDLHAYFAVVRSDSSLTQDDDEVFLGQDIIEPAADAGFSKYAKLDRDFRVHFDSATEELFTEFRVDGHDRVVINVQDLTGRLIQYFDLGVLSPGNYQEHLNPDKVDKSGIYFVSLFLGNKVFDRKIYIE